MGTSQIQFQGKHGERADQIGPQLLLERLTSELREKGMLDWLPTQQTKGSDGARHISSYTTVSDRGGQWALKLATVGTSDGISKQFALSVGGFRCDMTCEDAGEEAKKFVERDPIPLPGGGHVPKGFLVLDFDQDGYKDILVVMADDAGRFVAGLVLYQQP